MELFNNAKRCFAIHDGKAVKSCKRCLQIITTEGSAYGSNDDKKHTAHRQRRGGGRGEQLIRWGRGYDRRTSLKSNGLGTKTGARNGDFGHSARVYFVLRLIPVAGVIRFFGAYPDGDRGDGGGIFGREALGENAR